MVLCADDTTLYKPITCKTDLSYFQKDIDAIHNWFCSNHLTTNARKTKIMIISTKKDLFSSHATLDEQLTHRKS